MIEPEFPCTEVALQSLLGITRHARQAETIQCSKIVPRNWVVLFGGATEPFFGYNCVLRHAVATLVQQRHHALGVGVTLFGKDRRAHTARRSAALDPPHHGAWRF